MQEAGLQLFVYGTLKRGFANHRLYCREALFVAEARIEGRLYQLPPGYPGLVIPEGNVLAEGSADLRADWEIQRRIAVSRPVGESAETNREWARGEVFSFSHPETALREIDRLEDFHPGGGGLYRRVLAEVLPGGLDPLAVWLYVIDQPSDDARFLPEGVWPEAQRPA